MKKSVGTAVGILMMAMLLGSANSAGTAYEPVVPDERTQAAYIEQIVEEQGQWQIVYDPIEWYEGEAAAAVFVQREPDSGLEGPPDGYYIVNDDHTQLRLPLAADATVLMQIYDRGGDIDNADIVWNEPITPETFVHLFDEDAKLDASGFPYHLTVENGQIVKIVQQFVP